MKLIALLALTTSSIAFAETWTTTISCGAANEKLQGTISEQGKVKSLSNEDYLTLIFGDKLTTDDSLPMPINKFVNPKIRAIHIIPPPENVAAAYMLEIQSANRYPMTHVVCTFTQYGAL